MENETAKIEAEKIKIQVGRYARIRRGQVGEGHVFRVTDITPGHFDEVHVYGHNFGPVRLSEVELNPVQYGA